MGQSFHLHVASSLSAADPRRGEHRGVNTRPHSFRFGAELAGPLRARVSSAMPVEFDRPSVSWSNRAEATGSGEGSSWAVPPRAKSKKASRVEKCWEDHG